MEPWLIAFGIVWFTEFLLFRMQRATLLISRRAGFYWKGGGELLLPSWYPLTWLVIFGKWGLLVAMAAFLDWRIAVVLGVGGFFLSTLLPLPYSVYKGIFQARIRQLAEMDRDLAAVLQRMLDNAPF